MLDVIDVQDILVSYLVIDGSVPHQYVTYLF